MSALSKSAAGRTRATPTPSSRSPSRRFTPSDGVFTSAPRDAISSSKATARSLEDADSMTETGSQDDLGSTSEVKAFDDEMLESTAARPAAF